MYFKCKSISAPGVNVPESNGSRGIVAFLGFKEDWKIAIVQGE